LSTAIIASMSIPGVFPPVEIDGEMYVDGGIMEPVPVEAARRAGADVVIAVDVRRELEEINHDSIVTNLQLTLYFLLDANTEAQLRHADRSIAWRPGWTWDFASSVFIPSAPASSSSTGEENHRGRCDSA